MLIPNSFIIFYSKSFLNFFYRETDSTADYVANIDHFEMNQRCYMEKGVVFPPDKAMYTRKLLRIQFGYNLEETNVKRLPLLKVCGSNNKTVAKIVKT